MDDNHDRARTGDSSEVDNSEAGTSGPPGVNLSMLDTSKSAVSSEQMRPLYKLPRNPEKHVFGRSKIIDELETDLKEGTRRLLLRGRTEVGKKEITLQLASWMRDQCSCSCIFYINCAEREVMEECVQSVCQELRLTEAHQTNYGLCMLRLNEHLEKRQDFLIILANCQEEAQKMLTLDSPLRRLIGHKNGYTILTTSLQLGASHVEFGNLDFKSVEVSPLAPEEGRNLIIKYLGQLPYTEEDVQNLYTMSEGSPGVLKRMLDHIRRTQQTLTQFLANKNRESSGDKHDLDVIDLKDFRKIEEQPLLCGLFYLICLFSPHASFDLLLLKEGLPEAMKYDLGESCCHTQKLKELARDLKTCTANQTRGYLKEKLELPLTHQLLEVTGKDLERVRVPRVIQQKYLRFIKESCANCDSAIQKITCLCLTEAPGKDTEHSSELDLHLKAVLERSVDKQHSVFTPSCPIALKTRAVLARHYVEDGKFISAAKLLSTYREEESPGGIFDTALDWLRETFRSLLGNLYQPREQHVSLANLAWLGRAHLELGNCEEAIKTLNRAAKSPTFLADPLAKGVVLAHLGSARTEAGQREKAKEDLRQAKKALQDSEARLYDEKYNVCDLGLFPGVKPIAYLHSRFGKLRRWEMFNLQSKETSSKEDKELLKEVIRKSIKDFETARENTDNRHIQLIMGMYVEVQKVQMVLVEDGKVDPECFSRCEEIVRELGNSAESTHEHHYQYGWAKEQMAWIRSETYPNSQEELEEALKEINTGLSSKEHTYNEDHRKIANTCYLEALVLEKLNRYDKAIECLEKAKASLSKSHNDNPKLTLVQKKLKQLTSGHN